MKLFFLNCIVCNCVLWCWNRYIKDLIWRIFNSRINWDTLLSFNKIIMWKRLIFVILMSNFRGNWLRITIFHNFDYISRLLTLKFLLLFFIFFPTVTSFTSKFLSVSFLAIIIWLFVRNYTWCLNFITINFRFLRFIHS